jgi:hypothetical protein
LTKPIFLSIDIEADILLSFNNLFIPQLFKQISSLKLFTHKY